jgi:pimeloyl-ACP methyl ester carboxylesterase
LEAIHAAPTRLERGPERTGMKAMYLPQERAFLRCIEIPGDGPPLLWLHGWQCSSTGELMPAAVQPPLRSRRSLLVDFLGHGYSDKPLDFAYTSEAHARTIVALIDGLGLTECGIVGHSMGGAVAVLVAAARPAVVSLLVLAEASVDPAISVPLSGQTEDRFVELGFAELLGGQAREAHEKPGGIRAAHLEMTRLIEARAIYREGLSLERGTDPSVRSLLGDLRMPRWYLMGGLSDPEPELERDLGAMGVGWKVVPETGHAMGLQNPAGLGTAVAEAVVASWPG